MLDEGERQGFMTSVEPVEKVKLGRDGKLDENTTIQDALCGGISHTGEESRDPRKQPLIVMVDFFYRSVGYRTFTSIKNYLDIFFPQYLKTID